MKAPLESFSWPVAQAPQALRALARAAGHETRPEELPPTPAQVAAGGAGAGIDWLNACAGWLGVEVEAVDASYPEVDALLAGAAPALVELPGGAGLLAVLRGEGARLVLLGPGLERGRVPREAVRAALCREVEASRAAAVERVLEEAAVPGARRARARAALLREQLGARRVGGVWMLRPLPGTSFREQARRAGLVRRAGTLVAAFVGQSALLLLSWWLLGRGALQGHLDTGWLSAWALVLLTMLPLRLLSAWSGGQLAVGAGTLLKQRLLAGALRLEPEEVRRQGAGQLLGQVLESNAVETLAISGGLVGVASGIELLLAMGVLAWGAGGWLQALALVAVAGAVAWAAARYSAARSRWTSERLSMTHALVERMAGHRTRLVQEPRERWHDGEDEALERYLASSRRMDGRGVLLANALPDGWLCLGLLGLAGALVGGAEPAGLAVALGGVLLAYGALRRLALGLTQVAGAAIAWRQVRGIFAAAAREDAGSPTVARARSAIGEGRARPLVEGSGLAFRYPDRAEPVLRDCAVRIVRGERLLLEGPSGGGKSTLGAIVSGLRVPQSGLLLVGGLDRRTLGLAGWRERVVAAPQFHENHVLTGTFAFNLLMGRGWPGGAEELREAEELCRELALGDLLDRMPAGLHQMVGETGWQLSHGERSRLFIARALLQRAELVVLDESFAALDPDTLRAAMGCVLKRARTLLVIAHP